MSQYLCILEQNIINEKLYLFFWWWIMVMIGVASSSLIWRVFVVTIRSYRETQIKDMVNFDIWRHMEKNKQSSTDKARPIFLIIKLLD